ncbi:phosphoribosyltransferase family protein [Sorangium sp. So ce834]|uniref:phosphoribosyltransferase family protein n=1 Tax=Sorangium sp. So ce834 TaxID=3133321 RepID=UPI003F63D021
MLFRDRVDAGRRLAFALRRYRDEAPVVLGLPRGGVPVAYEVARALKAPLDVWVVRKIGAPGYEELGLGAISEGERCTSTRPQRGRAGGARRPPRGGRGDRGPQGRRGRGPRAAPITGTSARPRTTMSWSCSSGRAAAARARKPRKSRKARRETSSPSRSRSTTARAWKAA